MRTAFAHYGGKGMIVSRYPKPKHDIIVEPFAGAAAYSCRYYYKNVILIDKNQNTCAIWEFLKSDIAIDIATAIPQNVTHGDKIDDILDKLNCLDSEHAKGIEWFLRSAANVGVYGTGKRANSITTMGASKWHHNTAKKIKYWADKIKHWTIINGSYEDAPDITATWFIDPPYKNDAGRRYQHSAIDYDNLAQFVGERVGQIIVCENKGATWLEGWRYLASCQGRHGLRIDRSKEVVYLKSTTPP